MNQTLQTNSFLQGGRYKIKSTLGQGGFGITYLAIQSGLERKVAIKEFFMKEFCERDESTSHVTIGTAGSRETVGRFREKFLKEARTLANMVHPNIVRVIDVFEENGTAYYVMDYVEGESLSELVKRNGALSEDAALNYISQVANALSCIHAKSINHLDIKPANMMVRRSDNSLVLIDFGLSKQYDSTGGQTSSTPIGISEGYAPLEQYQAGGVSTFTPQTDIYSLGATLFYLVTGAVPPSASEVLNNGIPALPSHISASTKTAINQAMQFRKNDRPQSVKAFLNLLDGNSSATTASQNSNRPKAYKTVFVDDEATKVVGMSDLDRQLEENKRKKEAERKAAEEKARKAAEEKAAKEKREREEADFKRREREAEEERNQDSMSNTLDMIHWNPTDALKLDLSWHDSLGMVYKTVFVGSLITLAFVLVFSILDYAQYHQLGWALVIGVPNILLGIMGILGARGILKRKPGAIFLCLSYAVICTIINAADMIASVIIGQMPSIIAFAWIIFGIKIIHSILFSDDVKLIFPKTYRKISWQEIILVCICVITESLIFYMNVLTI